MIKRFGTSERKGKEGMSVFGKQTQLYYLPVHLCVYILFSCHVTFNHEFSFSLCVGAFSHRYFVSKHRFKTQVKFSSIHYFLFLAFTFYV